jgi:hypothetical protein
VQVSFVRSTTRARLGAALLAAAVIGPAAFALTGPSAQAAAVPASATAAASWLGSQITANGGSLPGFVGADVGLTEDAVLAMTAAGQGESDAARAATAEIASHITDFVSFDNFGVPDVHLAGPLAKSLLLAAVQGADQTSFGGRNLETELRGTLTASGTSKGRFSDQGTTDTSNGFSQAIAILALLRTNGGVPADAVTYLLAQQCPSGAFRLFYDTGTSCTDDSQADTDATGLAVQALAALPATAPVTAAIGDAATWLQGKQNPTTGSFNGSGPTDVPNTNSTGLATAALRLAGANTAADKGQAYIEAQQLSTGSGAGAIGYDPAAKAAATGGTIGSSDLDQWRRATSQALLGLGIPSYGQIVAVPTAPTTSPTTSPTTCPTTSPTTSPTSTTSTTSGSVTVSATSATGASSGPTVLGENSSAVSGLAATGGVPAGLVLFGLLALLLGIGITVAATDRAVKHR